MIVLVSTPEIRAVSDLLTGQTRSLLKSSNLFSACYGGRKAHWKSTTTAAIAQGLKQVKSRDLLGPLPFGASVAELPRYGLRAVGQFASGTGTLRYLTGRTRFRLHPE